MSHEGDNTSVYRLDHVISFHVNGEGVGECRADGRCLGRGAGDGREDKSLAFECANIDATDTAKAALIGRRGAARSARVDRRAAGQERKRRGWSAVISKGS